MLILHNYFGNKILLKNALLVGKESSTPPPRQGI